MRRFSFTLFVGLTLCAQFAMGQGVPRAGRNFSFGIIEGPDQLNPADTSIRPSHLSLTVLSPYDGCGTYFSPSGEFGEFTFSANQATILDLPYRLMHLHDLGQTKKGILVHTNEPANLVLMDSMPEAGDATQIYPNEALDTDYVVSEWGIWNDLVGNENNRVQFLITASKDSTLVRITPSVRTLMGQPAGVPFSAMLMRGECYIVKADSSSPPVATSLAGSLVSASKPVSVIVGTTCAYVELGMQSCNEVMDEILGKKWWGSHFYVQPLGNLDSMVEIVMTSDRQFFASINGALTGSANNRIWAEFFGPAEIQTFSVDPEQKQHDVKVEMEQLTRGSTFAGGGQSDPTMVTILDQSFYSDTMLWNAPHIVEPGGLGGFANWAPIIYPTSQVNNIQLDGLPLSAIPAAKIFGGSSRWLDATMSAINVSVDEGVHLLTSPAPIFALGTGFQQADAYSFMLGTTAGQVPRDTAHHTIILKPEPASACGTFGVSASFDTPITPIEFVTRLSISIRYDPTTVYLVSLQPHALLTQGLFKVDSSIPGLLSVTIAGLPLTGSDLFRIVFGGSRSIASTTIGAGSTVDACGDAIETTLINPVAFAITPSTDTLPRTIALRATTAKSCNLQTITLLTDSIVHIGDNFIPVRVEVLFDTALEHFQQSQPGSLISDLHIKESGQASGHYQLGIIAPQAVSGSDTLLLLTLAPHASTNSTTLIAKIFYLFCGDTVEKILTLTNPIAPNIDSGHTSLSVATSPVSFGNPASADVNLFGLPKSALVNTFDLTVTFDPNVLDFISEEVSGTLTSGWKAKHDSLSPGVERITFTSSGGPLGTAGVLTHLLFKTFVADSSSSPIAVSSSLTGTSAGCAVLYKSPDASTVFLGKDLCGDTTLRAVMESGRIVLESVSQASDGTLVASIFAGLSEVATLRLLNTLGETLWSGTTHLRPGAQRVRIPVGAGTPSGAYVLRAQSNRSVVSRKVVLVR